MSYGKTYALGMMFKHWVEDVRGPSDTALLIALNTYDLSRFLTLCAELTGCQIEPDGTISLEGKTIAYSAAGNDQAVGTYRTLCAALVPVKMTIWHDPMGGSVLVADAPTFEDPVDSDGLYHAVPAGARP